MFNFEGTTEGATLLAGSQAFTGVSQGTTPHTYCGTGSLAIAATFSGTMRRHRQGRGRHSSRRRRRLRRSERQDAHRPRRRQPRRLRRGFEVQVVLDTTSGSPVALNVNAVTTNFTYRLASLDLGRRRQRHQQAGDRSLLHLRLHRHDLRRRDRPHSRAVARDSGRLPWPERMFRLGRACPRRPSTSSCAVARRSASSTARRCRRIWSRRRRGRRWTPSPSSIATASTARPGSPRRRGGREFVRWSAPTSP